jgi:hypothetical protein
MQEAYAICQEVLAESPSDDAVIHPLRLTLVRLGRGTRDAKLGRSAWWGFHALMLDGVATRACRE